jgi:hypothetical protein
VPFLLDVLVSPRNLHVYVPSSDESGQGFEGEEGELSPENSPSAVEQLTSPIGTRLLKKKVQQQAGQNDANNEVAQGMVDDPNQCSSPCSTELMHRRAAFQRARDEDGKGLSSLNPQSAHGMVDDPNQCSSPCSTELMHRRAAFQRARDEDGKGLSSLGPQLSSPVGTALLNKKAERQRRAFEHNADSIIMGVVDHSPSGDGGNPSFAVHGSEGSLRFPQPSAKSGVGGAALAHEEPPAMMGVPARTAWEASAAEGNPLLSCLRCLGKQQQ